MQPGEVFRKGWILLNDGSMPWDSHDIQLINLSNGIEVLQQPMVPITAPHDRAVITVDYTCANQAGTYESKWILAYREQTFGPMIWCSIEVSPTKKIKQENPLQDFEFIDFEWKFHYLLVLTCQNHINRKRIPFAYVHSLELQITGAFSRLVKLHFTTQ